MPVASLQQDLGYSFRDQRLLQQALTHRSFGQGHNERLEFLGDAVLDLIVSEALYRRWPSANEGELSHWRSLAVRGEQLADLARKLHLGEYLSLGLGEARSGGRERDSILADAFEAVLGAIYLDGGLEAASAVLGQLLEPILEQAVQGSGKDAKTQLQEYLQARQQPLPEYRQLARSGAEHASLFTMACRVDSLGLCAEATASSRKRAEQLAAEAVLRQLER